ncbi:hypothetical protein PybrP1_001672 [[Pythium] brassicae (nom. inval.)]|nr:hypothetical protein PybrP1_001672 [[Pythium] brassicae (nom. inval.)]
MRSMGTLAADQRRHRGAAAPSDALAPPLPPPLPSVSSRLTLERVLGVTSLSNAMVAVNPATGETAYAAGCIVVIYNLRRNKQVRYYRVEKSVACLCFSPSGQFLAIGEKGYAPAITIWDGADGTLRAELQRHKFGVACMAFSRDGRFLLSAGLVHDQQLFVWDLRDAMREPRAENSDTDDAMRGTAVGAAQVHEKILAMDYCQEGNFFVTAGEKHVKFWFLDDQDQFLLTGYEINGVPEIQHRDAVMAAKSDATFTGVACGYGACRLKTFAVTSDGTLCCFGASCIMERLVSLEATNGSAISVTEAYVAVAGSSSIVRLFDPSTLEYRATMPFPPPLGKANEPNDANSNILHPDEPHRYPPVLAVRVTGSHVIVLYSDRSLFIYDVSDLQNARVERSFLSHSGCVRDLQVAGRVRGVNAKGKLVYYADDGRRAGATADVVPNGTFVSCSDDNTMRLWHLDLHKPTRSSNGRFSASSGRSETAEASSAWKNPFSQEMLWVAYHDPESAFAAEDRVVLGGTCSFDRLLDIHSPATDHGQANGLRSVGIHPKQTQLVTGDREGNLTVLQLPALNTLRGIGAHNAEVHCVAFGGGLENDGTRDVSSGSEPCLMASSGRDRLVHVFDCSKEYAVVATLDNHSSAVTSLQFTRDGRKLLSCGADKNVVVTEVRPDGQATRLNSIAFTGGKVFDIALTSNGEELVVTSSNNRLDVHSLSTYKLVTTHHVGEQRRIDVCPGGVCVAMSGSLSDKTIRIVDLATGEMLADATGHGDTITAVKFTPDCRRLVSASSDGCIFVWRLPEAIQSAIKARLPRVAEWPVPLPAPPPLMTKAEPAHYHPQQQQQQQSGVLVPPPAPPTPAPKAPSVPQSTANQTKPPHNSELSAPAKTLPDAVTPGPTVAAAPSIPRSSAGKEAKGWKSKVAAPAPGPMAKTLMEDWMRTRESAKKTVYVAADTSGDDAALEPQVANERVHLAIDRSRTPDWAKTVKLSNESKKGARAEVQRPQSDISSDSDRIPDDDDDETETDDPLFIRQQSGEVHQFDIPHTKEITPARGGSRPSSARGEQNVMNLSVGSLDMKARGVVAASNSLALEREQLERRKKQIDTANAVAAMNTATALDASISSFTAGYASTRSDTSGIGLSGSVSLPPVSASLIDASLSSFTLGFQAPGERPRREEASVMNIEVSAGVNASISAFTSGYSESDTLKGAAVAESVSLPSVAASLSTFTSGYNPDESAARSVSSASNSTSQVAASLSAFTSGYEQHVPSVELTASPIKEGSDAPRINNVSASLSVFTTGELDQQLEAASKTFGELQPTSSASAPDVQEIQQLVTQLRAAIGRFSATDS